MSATHCYSRVRALPWTDNVPVLIVSAGLSDVIEEFLRQHGALSENLAICSNRLNYDADAAPKSVSPDPPITSFTKEYAYSSASAFFARHKERRGIIQLGDSLTDVDPAKKVPYGHLNSLTLTHLTLTPRSNPIPNPSLPLPRCPTTTSSPSASSTSDLTGASTETPSMRWCAATRARCTPLLTWLRTSSAQSRACRPPSSARFPVRETSGA